MTNVCLKKHGIYRTIYQIKVFLQAANNNENVSVNSMPYDTAYPDRDFTLSVLSASVCSEILTDGTEIAFLCFISYHQKSSSFP